MSISQEWSDYMDEIFDLKIKKDIGAQGLAPEHLAGAKISTKVVGKEFQVVLEVTISLQAKHLKSLSEFGTRSLYYDLWNTMLSNVKYLDNTFVLEYNKSGLLHLHGWVSVTYPANAYLIDDDVKMCAFVKPMFLKLPKSYWKQYGKLVYHRQFNRLQCPLVCVNMKDDITSGWEEYIHKMEKVGDKMGGRIYLRKK